MLYLVNVQHFNHWIYICLLTALTWLVATYSCDGWPTKKDEKRVCAFEMKAYRRVLRVSWTDKRSNEWVLQKLGLHNTSLMVTVKERKLKYFGHTIRKSISGKGYHWRNDARIQSTWKTKDELYEQCYVMDWIKNRGRYQSSRWQRSLDKDCLWYDQPSYQGRLRTEQATTCILTFKHIFSYF